ncbi:MAG: sigma-70 family RNA polymerase sigma factor [Microlunatus sp.]|nr:sigma-70 family RNA polymerase sigma factor [Microlunatus sp.]
MLAATVRITRDLDLAEDCTQDAFARALQSWPENGIPARPGAWLTTVAGNRARDLLRRESRWQRALPELIIEDAPGPDAVLDPFADDQLRLIFTCCHPALPREAQIALTLRLVCGLSTAEVARAFLVREPTMAARITRAKKKIATARIPYKIPGPDDLPARIAAVCEVLHLVFTTGHLAPVGDQLLRVDLSEAAIRLSRVLHGFLPRDREVSSLLALMLLTDSRRDARTTPAGELVLLADQDRGRWNRDQISEGITVITDALAGAPPTAYGIEAAIAAVHAEAATWQDTDWDEIVGLYDLLLRVRPSPVITMNRAIAIGMRDGPAAGLALLDPLLEEPALATYPYLAAARADFLRRLGQSAAAIQAYQEALAITDNEVERRFLQRRLDQLH